MDLDPPRARLRSLYAALWQCGRGMRRHWLAALSMLAAAEGFKLLIPWLSGRAIDALQRQGTAGVGEAAYWAAFVLAVAVGSWFLHGPGRVLESRVAQHMRARFAAILTDKLLDAPLAWHRSSHSADTSQRLAQSSHALYEFAQAQYLYLQNSIALVGPIVALWWVAPELGLLALGGYAVVGLISAVFDRALVRLTLDVNAAERRYAATLVDIYTNVLTVFTLRRRSGMARLASERLQQACGPERRMFVLNELRWATVDILANVLWMALVGTYVWLMVRQPRLDIAGGLSLGGVFMVHEYARRTDGVVTVVVDHLARLNAQVAGFAAAGTIFDTQSEARIDGPSATAWRRLELAEVKHHHATGPATLNGVDLVLRRGRRYALIGPSGSGKSSLLQVLSGMEPVTSGSIHCDALPQNTKTLRREATLIPQQAELFEGSVLDNLLLGSTPVTSEIGRVLKLVQAEQWLGARGQGLGAKVIQGGANWSGGQRQRLSLARGVLAARDSSLVMFDEPGSGLDHATERAVMHALLNEFDGACVVVALHALHLLDLFDNVIVIGDGRITDMGTLAELNARCALPGKSPWPIEPARAA